MVRSAPVVTKFLFPHTFSNNTTLTFSLRNSVVAVAIVEGLTTHNLTAFIENKTYEFFELAQAIRRDSWMTVKHLSVAYEDVWIRLCYGSELAGTQFDRHFSESDVVLVVIINTSGRCDSAVVATSLESAARSSSLMRTSSSFLASMLKRHSGRALRLTEAQVLSGIDLTANTADILEKKAYLCSANTLEDVLGAKSTDAMSSGENVDIVRITQEDLDDFLNAGRVANQPQARPQPAVAPVVHEEVPIDEVPYYDRDARYAPYDAPPQASTIRQPRRYITRVTLEESRRRYYVPQHESADACNASIGFYARDGVDGYHQAPRGSSLRPGRVPIASPYRARQ